MHHTTADYHISVRTNSKGIPSDSEFAVPKPEGVIRIAGVGDSLTFVCGVEVEDTNLPVWNLSSMSRASP